MLAPVEKLVCKTSIVSTVQYHPFKPMVINAITITLFIATPLLINRLSVEHLMENLIFLKINSY